MWASAQEVADEFFATTFGAFEWAIRDAGDNGEFITWATVDLFEKGTLVGSEKFFGSSEEPGPDATTQALSFARSWQEAEERRAEAARLGVHPLELAFAPYGPEWQHEQAERADHWFGFDHEIAA